MFRRGAGGPWEEYAGMGAVATSVPVEVPPPPLALTTAGSGVRERELWVKGPPSLPVRLDWA